MSSSYDSGSTNAKIKKTCPKCGVAPRKHEGQWPSQTVKCAKCGTILGYTK